MTTKDKQNRSLVALDRIFGPMTILLLVLLGAYAVLYGGFSYTKIAYPYPLEVGEGEVLNYAATIARGDDLYRPLGPDSTLIVNYPPAVPSMVAALIDPDVPSMKPGRALAVAFGVAAALLVLAAVRSRGAPWTIAGIAGLLYLLCPVFAPVAATLRVDLFAVPLSFAGLVYLALVPGRRGALVAAVLFTAGLFAKHSTIFAPTAALAYLVVCDRRRLAWLAGGLVVLGGGMTAILQAETGGEFLRHLLVYTFDRYTVSHLLGNMAFVFGPPTFIPALVGLLAAGLWVQWAADGGHRDPFWYYLPAAALSLLLFGKDGSSVYYFLDFALACALTIGVRVGRLANAEGGGQRAAALLILLPLLVLYGASYRFYRSDFVPRDRHEREAKVLFLIRKSTRPVLSEDVGLIVLAGKVPAYPNTYSLTAAIDNGYWDPQPLLDDLATHRIGFVVTESDVTDPDRTTRQRLHPRVLEAVRKYYATEIGARAPRIYFPTGTFDRRLKKEPASPE